MSGYRLFDPDPGSGDRPGPPDVSHLIPAWLNDASPRMKALIIKHLEDALSHPTPARHPCAWLGCDKVGAEQHHCFPRELFGRLAEFGPLIWLCHDHHGLVSAVFDEARRHRTSTS